MLRPHCRVAPGWRHGNHPPAHAYDVKQRGEPAAGGGSRSTCSSSNANGTGWVCGNLHGRRG
jgi:hypothetical protein